MPSMIYKPYDTVYSWANTVMDPSLPGCGMHFQAEKTILSIAGAEGPSGCLAALKAGASSPKSLAAHQQRAAVQSTFPARLRALPRAASASVPAAVTQLLKFQIQLPSSSLI